MFLFNRAEAVELLLRDAIAQPQRVPEAGRSAVDD